MNFQSVEITGSVRVTGALNASAGLPADAKIVEAYSWWIGAGEHVAGIEATPHGYRTLSDSECPPDIRARLLNRHHASLDDQRLCNIPEQLQFALSGSVVKPEIIHPIERTPK